MKQMKGAEAAANGAAPQASADPKADKKKAKKGGKDQKGAASGANVVLDQSQLSPEQMTQMQMEQAIKESQDPSSRLKKLRSPLSVRGCLLNLLILIVLTVGIVLLCCYLMLDRETFNLGTVIKDMLDKFKITDFFKMIGRGFKKLFHIK